jgi:hypothetical protein
MKHTRVADLAAVVQLARSRGGHGVDAGDVRALTGVDGWTSREMLRRLVAWKHLHPAGRRRPTRCGRPMEVYVAALERKPHGSAA